MGYLLCGFSIFPLLACSKCLEEISAKDIMLKIATDTLFHAVKEMALNELQSVSLGPWLTPTDRCHRACNQMTNLRPKDPCPSLQQFGCFGHLTASIPPPL